MGENQDFTCVAVTYTYKSNAHETIGIKRINNNSKSNNRKVKNGEKKKEALLLRPPATQKLNTTARTPNNSKATPSRKETMTAAIVHRKYLASCFLMRRENRFHIPYCDGERMCMLDWSECSRNKHFPL